MESFSITSKCCFRGLITLPKNISWGNTEMLLCTYCIGQSPKMGNGNGFWHHCRDSGMIIILASFTVGSASKSFSLFCSSCFCVCVSERQGLEESGFLSGKCLLSLLSSCTLLVSSVLLLCLFLLVCLLLSSLVSLSDGLNEGSGYSAWQQIRGTGSHSQPWLKNKWPKQLWTCV